MRQLEDITKELESAATILELTSAFEGIASMKIAQIKDQTLSSQKFFSELWQIYSQIRVDELFHFGRQQLAGKVNPKTLLILITSEGGFSGEIDQNLLDEVLKNYSPDKNDIVVVGSHGLVQLLQKEIKPVRSFKLPQKDMNINVLPLTEEAQKYHATFVYYPTYKSLMDLEIKSIRLSDAVTERGKNVAASDESISEANYIFEPSTYDVVDHLERSMMQITLSEVLLEAKLAQYASRFRAMSSSHLRANDLLDDLNRQFNRAKRQLKDERLKEVINGLRSASP